MTHPPDDYGNRSLPRAAGYVLGTTLTKLGVPELLNGVRGAWPLDSDPPPSLLHPALALMHTFLTGALTLAERVVVGGPVGPVQTPPPAPFRGGDRPAPSVLGGAVADLRVRALEVRPGIYEVSFLGYRCASTAQEPLFQNDVRTLPLIAASSLAQAVFEGVELALRPIVACDEPAPCAEPEASQVATASGFVRRPRTGPAQAGQEAIDPTVFGRVETEQDLAAFIGDLHAGLNDRAEVDYELMPDAGQWSMPLRGRLRSHAEIDAYAAALRAELGAPRPAVAAPPAPPAPQEPSPRTTLIATFLWTEEAVELFGEALLEGLAGAGPLPYHAIAGGRVFAGVAYSEADVHALIAQMQASRDALERFSASMEALDPLTTGLQIDRFVDALDDRYAIVRNETLAVPYAVNIGWVRREGHHCPQGLGRALRSELRVQLDSLALGAFGTRYELREHADFGALGDSLAAELACRKKNRRPRDASGIAPVTYRVRAEGGWFTGTVRTEKDVHTEVGRLRKLLRSLADE